MADTYRHGIYSSEVSTTITAMTQITTPTVAFGTAPVHLALEPVNANVPVLCSTLAEFVAAFGWSDDFEKYTLCEVARAHFQLFNVAPLICINVLDTAKHSKETTLEIAGVNNPATLNTPIILSTLTVTSGEHIKTASIIGVTGTEPLTIPQNIDAENFTLKSGDNVLTVTEDYTVENGKVTLTEEGATKVSGNLTFESGEETFRTLIKDTDFTAAYDSDGKIILTIANQDKVIDDKISVSYREVDTTAVTASDVIGGVNIMTGKNTGMELVEEIYPRFGLVPGQLIAPKFSASSTVAAVMAAKASEINGVFQAMALADLPTDKVRKYTDATTIKNGLNFVDNHLITCYPKIALGGVQYHLSTQVAALCCQVDSNHDNIPYESPSNKNLSCDQSILADGTDIFLGKAQANYLNGQGIVTALNFVGGWKCWGNRTSAYPVESDPKDNFLPCRRMMNWINNSLVVNYWSRIDNPLNRRLVEQIVDEANIWLNALTARGAILGGRVEFLDSENPKTDLVNGTLRFHVYIAPPTPAREISFVLEYDVSYLANLFAA